METNFIKSAAHLDCKENVKPCKEKNDTHILRTKYTLFHFILISNVRTNKLD